jgi:hypothetical protein
MLLFSGFDFCVQLVWIIVYKICNIVCSYEKKKTMFAIEFFYSEMVTILLHIWVWTVTKLLILGGFHIVFKIIFQI